MIEKIRARTGETVFKVEGRLTASGVDPKKEARRWVEKALPRIGLRNRIVVLGLGSGHHIVDLKGACPGKTVVVIEPNGKLIHEVCLQYPLEMGEVEIVCVSDPKSLFRSQAVLDTIVQPFVVLEHKPSMTLSKDYFSFVQEILLGRTDRGVQWHLDCREFIKDDFASRPCSKSRKEALSIKDLDAALVDSEDGIGGAYMKIKVLRELVK